MVEARLVAPLSDSQTGRRLEDLEGDSMAAETILISRSQGEHDGRRQWLDEEVVRRNVSVTFLVSVKNAGDSQRVLDAIQSPRLPALMEAQMLDLGVPASNYPHLQRFDNPVFVNGKGGGEQPLIVEEPEAVQCDVATYVIPGNSTGTFVLPSLDSVRAGVLLDVGQLVTSSCNAGFELVATEVRPSNSTNTSMSKGGLLAATCSKDGRFGVSPQVCGLCLT